MLEKIGFEIQKMVISGKSRFKSIFSRFQNAIASCIWGPLLLETTRF